MSGPRPWGLHVQDSTSTDWQGDPPGGHHEIADADVELVIRGQSLGWYNLQIRHNTDTTSKSYAQKNSMTHLRWGNARPHIAQEGLLGCRLLLFRESGSAIPPRFRIEIEDI